MIDFEEQVAVVTGAGRGLGRVYALELGRRGAAVVVNDLGTSMQGDGSDPAVADSVVREIEQAGGTAVASSESVASPEGADAIVATAVERFGRLDAVISNAGIFGTVAFDDLSPRDWRRMLTVHLDGAFHLSRAAFPVMRRQRYGRFVFISSSAGMFGQPDSAHYCAAKAGTFGLANAVSIDGAEHGILANVVLPFGHSRMVTESVGGNEDLVAGDPFLSAIQPELVAPIVVFLASRECDFTHQCYSACAGRFARVFVGLGPGWMADHDGQPSVEEIAGHLDAIQSTQPFTVPSSIFDEIGEVHARLSGD